MTEPNPLPDDYFDRPLPIVEGPSRVTDHRCGLCSWQGTGRSDCRNRRRQITLEELRRSARVQVL